MRSEAGDAHTGRNQRGSGPFTRSSLSSPCLSFFRLLPAQRANEGGTWWNAARNTDAGNLTDSPPKCCACHEKKVSVTIYHACQDLHVSVRMCFARNAILPVQSAAPATKMSMDMSKGMRAPATKKTNHLKRASKVLCLSHKTIFDTFLTHVRMSLHATPAMQNNAETSYYNLL